jgi:hypothetical protein
MFLTYCTNAELARQENPQLRVVRLPADLVVAADYGIAARKDAAAGARLRRLPARSRRSARVRRVRLRSTVIRALTVAVALCGSAVAIAQTSITDAT